MRILHRLLGYFCVDHFRFHWFANIRPGQGRVLAENCPNYNLCRRSNVAQIPQFLLGFFIKLQNKEKLLTSPAPEIWETTTAVFPVLMLRLLILPAFGLNERQDLLFT